MTIALFKRPQYKKEAIAFSKQIRFFHDTLGLLGFTAMYNFLDTAFQDKEIANELREVLENVAGGLKISMGRKRSENTVLDRAAMVNVAALCEKVFDWLVGTKGDCSGYGDSG
jgi:hypothetical protein